MSNVVKYCEACQRTQTYGRCCVECGATLKAVVILCTTCGAVVWYLPAERCDHCQTVPLCFTANEEWRARA